MRREEVAAVENVRDVGAPIEITPPLSWKETAVLVLAKIPLMCVVVSMAAARKIALLFIYFFIMRSGEGL